MVCKIYGSDLVSGLDGDIVTSNIPAQLISYGVGTDTREMLNDFVFIALKGQNFDGHDFVDNAVRSGANCLVVDRPLGNVDELLSKGVYFVQVQDTLVALRRLAEYKRKVILAKTKVIAITGSVGKTFLSRSMGLVLSRFCEVNFPEKSYNNHVGVPLTVLNTSNSANILVVEIGMNHAGEVESLSSIVEPDIAIITNTSPAHVGNFTNGIDGIVEAKAEICKNLKPGGVLILNKSGEHFDALCNYAKLAGVKSVLTVGDSDNAHLYLSQLERGLLHTIDYEVTLRGVDGSRRVSVSINSICPHHAFSTMFIFAVARLFKFDLDVVSDHIIRLAPVEGRGSLEHIVVDKKRILIINDSYNANPASMKAGIESLIFLKKESPNRRAVCILGDMMELGDHTDSYHREIGEFITNSEIDSVITVGSAACTIAEVLPDDKRMDHFKHVVLLAKRLRSLIEDGDLILFKGSNSMNLSVAIDKLYHS